MALPATLHDFQIALSHVDRAIEQPLSFKVAQHPSERVDRLWLRVLAYCWRWDERLAFGPGLSDSDAPDLESRDYAGTVTRWIRVGKVDAPRLQRELDRHSGAQVSVLFESPERLEGFVAEAREAKLSRLRQAELAAVDPDFLRVLSTEEGRRHKLTLTLVGDHFYVDRGGKSFDGPLSFATLDG